MIYRVEVDSDLEEVIPAFMENRQKDLTLLKEAYDKEAFTDSTSIGHTLKGVGGGYGFNRITELGKLIEEASKEGDGQKLAVLIESLEAYLDQVEIVYVDLG